MQPAERAPQVESSSSPDSSPARRFRLKFMCESKAEQNFLSKRWNLSCSTCRSVEWSSFNWRDANSSLVARARIARAVRERLEVQGKTLRFPCYRTGQKVCVRLSVWTPHYGEHGASTMPYGVGLALHVLRAVRHA